MLQIERGQIRLFPFSLSKRKVTVNGSDEVS